MILNRKSAKKTSRISLFIAITMISTVFAVIQTQGYPVEQLTQEGVKACKIGFVEVFTSLLW